MENRKRGLVSSLLSKRKDWQLKLALFCGVVLPVVGFALIFELPFWWLNVWLFVLAPAGVIVSFLNLLVEDESKTGVFYYLEKIFWLVYMLFVMAISVAVFFISRTSS